MPWRTSQEGGHKPQQPKKKKNNNNQPAGGSRCHRRNDGVAPGWMVAPEERKPTPRRCRCLGGPTKKGGTSNNSQKRKKQQQSTCGRGSRCHQHNTGVAPSWSLFQAEDRDLIKPATAPAPPRINREKKQKQERQKQQSTCGGSGYANMAPVRCQATSVS